MKTFKNQQTSITAPVINEKGEQSIKEMTYVDLAMLVLSIPSHYDERGKPVWPRPEQKIRFKVEDKIEKLKVGKEVKLEDAEFDKIFEEFYRAANARSVERDGTGLGLSIVKQVAESHSGRAWAQNNPAGGSTFSFTLPKVHAESAKEK